VIGPSLKLSLDIWDRVLNSVPVFCYYIAHSTPFSFIFLQPTFSSKSPCCYCCKIFQLEIYFSTDPEPIRIHHSRLINIVIFFLFRLLIFAVKLKYTNSRVYRSYCRDENVADQCVSRRSNPEHFNRHGLRYSYRVHIFCRRDNQSL
jgi:hypothetical protein